MYLGIIPNVFRIRNLHDISTKKGADRRLFLAIYVSFLVVSILINYPGRVNPDTADMLWSVDHINSVTDGHSPFLPFMFAFVTPLFGKPFGAFILQAVGFLTLPAFIFSRAIAISGASILKIVGILLASCLSAVCIVMSGDVLKDNIVIAFLSVLLMLEVRAAENSDAPHVVARTVCGLGIILTRTVNSLLFIPWLAYSVWKSSSERKLMSAFMAICALMILVPLAPPLMRAATGASNGETQEIIQVFDVAGMSAELHQNLFKTDFSTYRREPWECYVPQKADPFIWGDCKDYGDFFYRNPHLISRLWMASILHHPFAYAAHRLEFTRSLLELDNHWFWHAVPMPPTFTDPAINTPQWITQISSDKASGLLFWRPTLAFVPFGKVAYAAFSTWMGKPVLWITILTACLLIGVRSKAAVAGVITKIALFGLTNVAVFAITAPDSPERYLLPTWFCTAVDVALCWNIFVGWASDRSKFYMAPAPLIPEP